MNFLIWNELKSVFVYDALRVSALYASFDGLICFSPSPKSPIKKPSKNSSLFRFNFSDKFSKGLKPSSVKLGYFRKGMNINQDWYWAFFSISSQSFFSCLFFFISWILLDDLYQKVNCAKFWETMSKQFTFQVRNQASLGPKYRLLLLCFRQNVKR